MKLYFHPLSGNSRRVLLVAAHLEVPLERIVVDLPTSRLADPVELARGEALMAQIRAWLARIQGLDAWQRTAPPTPNRA